ncbi:MAG: hypothetical protein JXB23_17770 [Candidatus Aminicenantes bacterium]|nr:hypothetical protein [Candidatus Aminicenantes bacterium]
MIHEKKFGLVVRLFIAAFFCCGLISSAFGADFTTDTFKNLKWRQIGPAAFGGRIDDVEAVPGSPEIIYIGAASGGIFKSEDNGMTWKAVFDQVGTALTIGDIAIAPSDPNIVWAGTGEPNNRQSSSWGDGVYRSLDGGQTWQCMGLKDTHHIGRIAIDPANPQVVFVAALGHLWGPNAERGIFRTRDGGKTWEKSLFINEDTGCVDVVMEDNGRIIYAAAYQRRRQAWGFIGGGPHAGIYRSLDQGNSWERLSNGLPEGDTGRIGLAVSRGDSPNVYAVIQHKEGGYFRSQDHGQTWVHMSKPAYPHMFMVYFSKIRVDPQNPDKIWDLGYGVSVSIDGGKTFTDKGTWENIHTDHHALWIDPNDPDHLLLAGDGGFYMSYNGSKTWEFVNNLPIAQFYAIGIDTRKPYWVYGGAQDHGAYGLPSRSDSRFGIRNCDVVPVAFGDAFYCVVDPENPHIVYTENQEGRLLQINMKTHEERVIRPVPDNPEEVYRFNWKCPLILSPHDHKTLYYGGNKILKSGDQGYSWETISPDLTQNQDWKKLPIMGMERTEETISVNYGVAHFGTITTLSESPVQAGLIYAGTDDGNVQVTIDGGRNWSNLSGRFRLSKPYWVSHVRASNHGAGTAYVCFDGHWADDFAPYLFKTEDFGKTWKSIRGDLPDGMVVNTLAEHPRNPNLLFIGTEFGLFLSVNGGANWVLARSNLPRVPVDDIIVNARENDLILGTHGRGIFIMDDITWLEKLDEGALRAEAQLFPVRDAVQYYESRKLPDPGAAQYFGPNPDYGALITYYLKNDPPQAEESENMLSVEIFIMEKDGNTVRKIDGPDGKGFHRVAWDLHYELGFDPEGTSEGYYEPKKGPFVLPGEYTVKLKARGMESTQTVVVSLDPRIEAEPDVLQKRLEASKSVNSMAKAFVDSRKAIKGIQDEIGRIKNVLKSADDLPQGINSRVDDISKKLDEVKKEFETDWYGMEFSIMDLIGQLDASVSAPTRSQMKTITHLHAKLDKAIELINGLITADLPKLNKNLVEHDIPFITVQPIKRDNSR